jgi:hypothetical protein
MPEHADFSVQADTHNGNIDTDFDLSTRDTQNNKTLSGSVGAGGPLLHITTTNGDISIRKGEVAPISLTLPPPPKITLTPPAAPKAPAAHKPTAAAPTPPI